jgi:DNA invertase Pin-like site-specific DNA recombinase
MSQQVKSKRAAVLARCSSEANVCSQIISLKKYALGKYIVDEDDVYGDNISGSSSISERPELTRLMQNIQSGNKHYDVILVEDVTRLGKTPDQAKEVLDWFARHNVPVKFSTE